MLSFLQFIITIIEIVIKQDMSGSLLYDSLSY